MKKFKYFTYEDKNLGSGEGDTLYYINANNKSNAWQKLVASCHLSEAVLRYQGDIKEIKNFIQPKQISIL